MPEKRYATNQPVKVAAVGHQHEGRAGIVIKEPAETPDQVVVNFDATPELSQTADLVNVADLVELR